MINKGMFTSNTDQWSTPQDFFDEVNKEFNFVLDVCCDENNCKKRMTFVKYCLGAMAGVGFGSNVNLLSGPTCNKECYRGWFFEGSVGPASLALGYDDSNGGAPGNLSGVAEVGVSFSRGPQMVGSAKWCYYVFDSEENLDECCE